ncbi:MAG: nickel pincer cofactor biosynthesis protein LarB [Firmicutes bacterium]|nr:nickel pincer cofactor biosynthesis protein LarB [Bacillota bacterium]
MDRTLLKSWLNALVKGENTLEETLQKLTGFPYSDLGFAKIDSHRSLRNGNAEVIYCPGKEPKQVVGIFQTLAEQARNVIATRANPKLFQIVKTQIPEARYFEKARIIALWRNCEKTKGKIGIITAGTADLKVAEEAAVTGEILGSDVIRIYDVGVAGIHRLFDQKETIESCRVLIVVAGMEGALASVVGGLVDKPVVAVPTSIGYGANFQGLAPLLSMLNSCAGGIAVVNIDNGFGAGVMAHRINLLGE